MGMIIYLLLGATSPSASTGREVMLEYGMVPEKPVSIDDYVLNAGDTLLVIVKGSYSYSYPTQITPTGQLMIMLPSSRPTTTFGKTLGDVSLVNLEAVGYTNIVDVPVKKARETVAKAFSEFIRPVQVDFVLLGPRACKINVLGDVQWPGSYLVTPFMRVKDGLDLAGGITSAGSVSNILLARRSGDSTNVNLRRYREDGDLESNPYLRDGDVVFVPKMERFVVLRGMAFSKEAIDEPAIQTMFLTDTVSRSFDAVARLEFDRGEKACDFLYKRAVLLPQGDISKCYIERGSQRIFFDMQAFLAGERVDNPVLEHGDIVTVPRIERYIYVTGEVRRQGPVFYDQTMTVNQYIGYLGGFLTTADLRSIRVLYPDGRTRRAHPDMTLEPGSTIYVPRRAMDDMRDWISLTAAGIALLTAIIKFGG